MSDIPSADELMDEAVDQSGEVGLTSEESASEDGEKKKSRFGNFTVFDTMLLMSLICVTLATLNMFLELNSFGNILGGEFPWRVSDFLK